MAVRNKRPDLNGVIVVDKPLGWTSADVCRRLRSRTNGAKVGHAGTLDPLATGVLVVCLGKATKLIESIQASEKLYVTTIDLSAFTTTDDAEGEREEITVDRPPTLEAVRAACDALTGETMQTPPAFSAVKVGGKRAYALARKGEDVRINAKVVVIHEIAIDRYDWPTLELSIRCGKGTYIRAIARDLGAALGTGGTLLALRRTRIGEYTLDLAINPEELLDRIDTIHDLGGTPTD
ncbi:MAG: tRNA pseudouridine(55) synthase TruB [Phycisphaerales bacterium]